MIIDTDDVLCVPKWMKFRQVSNRLPLKERQIMQQEVVITERFFDQKTVMLLEKKGKLRSPLPQMRALCKLVC